MIENGDILPYAFSTLVLSLVFIYISKKNKSKKVAWLVTLFLGAGMLLLVMMVYNELIIAKNDWWRFNVFCIFSLFLYISEVFDVFQKIPYYGDKKQT